MPFKPPDRPGRFALDRLIIELLVRCFDYQRNIHDAIAAVVLFADGAGAPYPLANLDDGSQCLVVVNNPSSPPSDKMGTA